ncbi:hypothetical protein PSACC_03570 [Paramicrosporidium saccamoebae]|uniref:BRCT domain-containing protein n=1 Tax=Paramicrosporidium saccamoebae TaxID=1246581 RepID=A0A2H9TG58_9FUNG|nr:hypothetical protein PSACC_03570 [Paramicrosporidium saccamoebae]
MTKHLIPSHVCNSIERQSTKRPKAQSTSDNVQEWFPHTAVMETDLDEQFLYQLSKSPLTAATDPPRILESPQTPARTETNNYERQPAEASSFMRPLTEIMDTPRVEDSQLCVRKEQHELLKSTNFLSDSDGLDRTRTERTDEIMPLKLFGLSLESPSQSRTSIEMPSSFSKAPSAKKKVCQSSQESIFVAATQFPAPPQISQTSLESFTDIPDTQYPANVVMTSIKDILSSMPMSSPKTAGSIADYSQRINLFDTPQKMNDLPEMDADLNLSDHTAVIFPPSDGEAVTVSEAPKIPSAMKKLSKKVTPSTKKVQFAPMPVSSPVKLKSRESILHSLGQGISSGTIDKRSPFPVAGSLKSILSPNKRVSSPSVQSLKDMTSPSILSLKKMKSPSIQSLKTMESPSIRSLKNTTSPSVLSLKDTTSPNVRSLKDTSPSVRSLKNTTSPGIRSTPKSIVTSSSQPTSLMEDVLKSTITKQRSSRREVLATLPSTGKRSLIALASTGFDTIAPLAIEPIPDQKSDTESLPIHKKPLKLAQRSSQLDRQLDDPFNRQPARSVHTQRAGSTEQCLSSHMLVWARWRPLHYAPAILQERLSRTRDLWKIRFCHWKETRHKSIILADFSPCDIRSLMAGDAVQVVRNRKRMDFRVGEFERWIDAGSISVRIDNVSEKVDLSRVVISRKVFQSLKTERCLSSNLPTSPATKRPRKTALKEWSFWITLGNLSSSAKRTQKSQLVTRIRSLGGTVLEDDAINVNPERTVLLCNGFCRTAKTFLALALRVPIVRLDWLETCEQSKGFVPLESFAIPIMSHSNAETKILQGWTIALEGPGSFRKGWTMVCQASGANIVPSLTNLDPAGQSRVLVDQLPSGSSRLSRWASQTGIIIVTVDWLMNSILSGRCL